MKIPTKDEERRFYRELKYWQAKLSYWIMRLQGLRRSEVQGLKHKNIDLDQEVMIIEKQKG